MICHCVRRGWEFGAEKKVLKFESAMMCTNNVVVDVVVMNLRLMDVVVLILLTRKPFPSTRLLPSSCLFSCSVVILVLLTPV